MARLLPLFTALLLLVVASTAPALAADPNADPDTLRVAVFQADATPPVGSRLAYDPIKAPGDKLSARGVVLLGSGKPIVLCSVDWLGIANDGQTAWRTALAEAVGTTVERVAVHAIHQHDAPRCDFSAHAILKEHGLHELIFDIDHARDVIKRSADAARKSIKDAKPVTHVGLGSATVEKVASNRRILGPNGKVIATRWTACRDPKLRALPEGVVDKELSLIALYQGDSPIVVMTWFATHPQSYYRQGMPSPDFPGLARNARDKVTGIPHIHFNGAGGNIGAGKWNDGSPKNRPVLAKRMEDGMAAAFKSVKRQPIKPSDVAWAVRKVTLPPAPHLAEDDIVKRLNDKKANVLQRILAAKDKAFYERFSNGGTVDIQCLALGNARVLHMPGELVVEYQLAAKKMRPDLHVAMAAYGDYAAGYICMAEHYPQGGYEAGRASRTAPAVEKVLMDAMRALLQVDPDASTDKPSSPDETAHVGWALPTSEHDNTTTNRGGQCPPHEEANTSCRPEPRGLVFTDVTEQAGLVKPLVGIMGHGGAFGDYDGDGHIDLFVGGFSDRPNDKYVGAAGPVPTRLFRNLGNGKFELVKDKSTSFHARVSGAVFADFDNDGKLELYSANNARPNSRRDVEPQRSAQLRHSNLLRFDGKRFTDITASSGASPDALHSARNVGVFDYDNDGLLDLLIVEDRFVRGGSRTTLLRNMGDLKFKDVNSEAGIPDGVFGLGLAVADINDDGRPDFFVPHSNRMFLSSAGNKYREVAELNDVFKWDPLDNEDWPCGAAFGDLNRDGKLDLVLSIHSVQARNKVYLNEGIHGGVPRFRDVTEHVGLDVIVPARCPHVEIQDFDNDGWPDIYISAAWRDEAGNVVPLVYHNRGINAKMGLPRFFPSRPAGLSTIADSSGAMVYYPAGPSGDYDNDGRIDLFLINWFEGNHCRLMRNTSNAGHWLTVRVVGKTMNRMGIGAKVRVYRAGQLGKADALLGYQQVTTGYGYASGQPAVCHFGLGRVKEVDVRVTLPNGKAIDRAGVKADQRFVIEE